MRKYRPFADDLLNGHIDWSPYGGNAPAPDIEEIVSTFADDLRSG
jgi:hypothetical protein